MYLTNPAIDADLVVALKEDAIKCVIDTIMLQRPSLFNYATQGFIDKPELMAIYPIPTHPSIEPYNQKLITLINFGIPVFKIIKTIEDSTPPTNGQEHFSLSIFTKLNCFAQVTTIQVEFSPGDLFPMPKGLPPLPDHHFSIHLGVAVGVGFPSLNGDIVNGFRAIDKGRKLVIETVSKFQMEVIITGAITSFSTNSHNSMSIDIDGFEVVDLNPEGLEGMIENFVKLEFGSVLIPQLLKYLTDTYPNLVYKIRIPDKSETGIKLPKSMDLSLTPVSTSLPQNPDFEDDTFEICIHLLEIKS